MCIKKVRTNEHVTEKDEKSTNPVIDVKSSSECNANNNNKPHRRCSKHEQTESNRSLKEIEELTYNSIEYKSSKLQISIFECQHFFLKCLYRGLNQQIQIAVEDLYKVVNDEMGDTMVANTFQHYYLPAVNSLLRKEEYPRESRVVLKRRYNIDFKNMISKTKNEIENNEHGYC